MITANKEQLAKAFDLWRERYEANPEGFREPGDFTGDYGLDCANYLIELVNEVEPYPALTPEQIKVIRELSPATNTPDEYYTERLF